MTFAEQMREFLRRNMSFFLAGGLVLLLIQDVLGTHGVLAMRRAQKEAARVQQEIDRVNNENRQLQDHVKALKSDPQAIERIAREEIGLARPGEIIFKIPPKPADPSGSATTPQPPQATPQP
ncbi:MAG TPA: septum formation initiator family protein [Candidatus Acidoferrales bacterium]|nr:septum formation initiator family protein [Candidatus Acidoferrales bacterium]